MEGWDFTLFQTTSIAAAGLHAGSPGTTMLLHQHRDRPNLSGIPDNEPWFRGSADVPNVP